MTLLVPKRQEEKVKVLEHPKLCTNYLFPTSSKQMVKIKFFVLETCLS